MRPCVTVAIESEPTTDSADFDRRVTCLGVTWLMGPLEMFIRSKMEQNLLGMEVRTFVRIQRVMWDQLLPCKAEIIHT